jgi:hypothetical protein
MNALGAVKVICILGSSSDKHLAQKAQNFYMTSLSPIILTVK